MEWISEKSRRQIAKYVLSCDNDLKNKINEIFLLKVKNGRLGDNRFIFEKTSEEIANITDGYGFEFIESVSEAIEFIFKTHESERKIKHLNHLLEEIDGVHYYNKELIREGGYGSIHLTYSDGEKLIKKISKSKNYDEMLKRDFNIIKQFEFIS